MKITQHAGKAAVLQRTQWLHQLKVLKKGVHLWTTATYWTIPDLMWVVVLLIYSMTLFSRNPEAIKQYPVTFPVPLSCVQRCNIRDLSQTVLSREAGCWRSRVQTAKLRSLSEFCPFFKNRRVSYGVANTFTCLFCIMNLEHIIYKSCSCVLYFTYSEALHVWDWILVLWHFLTMHNQFCKWSSFSLAKLNNSAYKCVLKNLNKRSDFSEQFTSCQT